MNLSSNKNKLENTNYVGGVNSQEVPMIGFFWLLLLLFPLKKQKSKKNSRKLNGKHYYTIKIYAQKLTFFTVAYALLFFRSLNFFFQIFFSSFSI